MLRPGIYTMHDFHVFRQHEFNECLAAGSFPCRWAPDATKGFGQPLFNFYGQIPYWVGAIFGLGNQNELLGVKLTFIFTLVAAAYAMFAFARSEFGDRVGLLAAVVYSWLPYRAVDVWVRGALNEAFAFVYYPLILWAAVRFVKTRQFIYAGWTSLLLALLLATHNLSFLMFVPFLGVVVAWKWWSNRNFHTILDFISIFLGAILLSAFYLFPVIAETGLISVGDITKGYYGYQLHWATLNQLFISRFWGYGGSGWGPNDNLSFAVGYIAWVPLILLGVYLVLARFKKQFASSYVVFAACSLLAIFLTHGKSEIIWKLIPPLSFIQFPWRFLAIAAVFGALVAGLWAKVLPKALIALFAVVIIFQGVNQFKPDIWKDVTQEEYFSGASWDEQRSSALTDYWPQSAKFVPTTFAPLTPTFMYGTGKVSKVIKVGPRAEFTADITSALAKVSLPIIYFPGWKLVSTGNSQLKTDSDTGLITIMLDKGQHDIRLAFTNTWPRTIGNIVSLLSFGLLLILTRKYAQK